MKIALAHPIFYPAIGGIEVYLKNLADEYLKMGHELKAFVCNTGSSQNTPAQRPQSLNYSSCGKFLRYPVPSSELIKKLIDFKPDIVHVNSPLPFASKLAWELRKSNLPIVSTYHAHVNPKSLFIKTAAFLETKTYKVLFKRIITTTEFYKNEVSKFYPIDRIDMIPLGVDEIFLKNTATSTNQSLKKTIKSTQTETKPTILFIGGLDENHYYKGVEVLLKTAKITPDLNYIIIGDGGKKIIFMQIAKRLKLNNVNFLGQLKLPDLLKYYLSSNVFVLPSTSSSEGYGMVLLEAMACGVPIITTNAVGSAKSISAAKAGIIINPNDPKALAENIKKILKDQNLRENLIKNGKKFVQKLSWNKCAKLTLQCYKSIIEKTSHS